ncbi:hypothetical protein [Psychrobacter sp. I-STPA10]|uniref:hypothetical protein n=1 Tax=Psychrobacter sp. I-STPA10 TaxID=2585769 RepID=UPI001E3A52CF|nr:hypothetical protein [Psychrobacter sp. I-STPA10]
MTIKSMVTAVILLGSLVISPQALADSDSISRQQAANPNNFGEYRNANDVPKSISHCSANLLVCAERVLNYGHSGQDQDRDLGKNIGTAEIFIYPQAKSKPDVGVVIITEQPYGDDGDDSVGGERYRIAFTQQKNTQGKPYWKFVSQRYQVYCLRGSEGWSKKSCV